MKLSACYIVKNAAQDLERSLRSLNGIVDEIIVVDTGSVDSTIEIAKKNGAKIYLFSWQEDFAAARNFALLKATGNWIVFLDADEFFFAKTPTDLKKIIRKYGENNDALVFKLINIDEDQDNRIIDYFFAPRVFRKNKLIYYVGKIHEQLQKNGQIIEKVGIVPDEKMCIYHTGYTTSRQEGKAHRNLELLLKELEIESEPEKLYLYLAEAYEGVGDTENAMKYAKLDIAQGRQDITYASRSHRIILRLLEQQDNIELSKICQEAIKAVENFPEMPEFHAAYAQYLAAGFDYAKAILEMEEAIVCYKRYNSLEPTIFDQQACKTAEGLIDEWKQIQFWQKKIKISACVITKNEAAEIGLWLDRIKQYTDEQIVIDTGSTDDTVAIVESAGIKVYRYAWDNDFAAAKNFAIEKATGDWIVFLDADEVFTTETVGNLRAIIAREHIRPHEVDAILCSIINIDKDKNNIEISRFVNLRIFRNVPYLRYQGSVHEQLQHQDAELRVLTEKNLLKIYHTGYSSNRIRSKVLRNLSILQADITEHGEGIQHYRYLADCYQELGDYEKAVKYAKLHIDSPASSLGNESEVYRTLINSMVSLGEESRVIRNYIGQAIKIFPDIPDFYAYYAMEYIRQDDFKNAKKYLLQAFNIYSRLKTKTVNSSAFRYILSEAYGWLAEIYWREGNNEAAKKNVELAMMENRYNIQAFRILYLLIKGLPTENIVNELTFYYEQTEKNIEFILSCLEKLSIDQTYFYYSDLLKRKWEKYTEKVLIYQLLADKNLDKAYDQALNITVGRLQWLVYAALVIADFSKVQEIKLLLPISFWHCIERYYNSEYKLLEDDWDGYKALLPVIIRWGNQQMGKQFSDLGRDFSKEHHFEMIRIFCQEKKWGIAGELLEPFLVTETEEISLEFWRLGGICFYNLGEFELATRCFRKKQQLNKTNDEESAAYLEWMQERNKS